MTSAWGAWSRGRHLPSIRQAARQLGITPMTVRRAYASLEEEGFVVGLPGKGVVVTELAPTPQAEAIRRQDSLSDLLRVTVTQAQALGYAPSEIQAAMTRALAEGDGAATILFVGAEPEFIEHYTPLLADAMRDLDVDVEAISLAQLEATGLRDLRSVSSLRRHPCEQLCPGARAAAGRPGRGHRPRARPVARNDRWTHPYST